jgi:hypothetical protein
MVFNGRTYLSNYDGSQDEVIRPTMRCSMTSFSSGSDAAERHPEEVRLIAINEGRLMDFLTSRGDSFSQLKT